MIGSFRSTTHSVAIDIATPSPSNSDAPLNRHHASPMSPISPGLEMPRLADHGGGWRARLSTLHTYDGAVGEAATETMNAWLKRRPPLDSTMQLPLRGEDGTPAAGSTGGMLYRYKASPSDPAAARCEAFYTTVPGVMMAALPVHPDAERRTGLPMPQASHVAQQLTDPPIGLLTGVWQNGQGHTFHLHNNVLHRMGAAGHWERHPLPASAHPAPLHVLGQQADGHVYAQMGDSLLKLVASGAEYVGRASAEGMACVDEHGAVHGLREGCLTMPHGGPARPIALLRQHGDGWEPSPARASQMAMAGSGQIVVLDDKGRLYDAGLGGSGPIAAQRIELPLPGGTRDWVVTSVGLANDGSVQALAQHRDGQRVSLQRPPGADAFTPAFMLDHALLLVGRQGLYSPADEELAQRVQLDGHAELGRHAGVALFRPSPEQPWSALNGADGKPLRHVEHVIASPFGFVDRKSAFAVLHAPGAPTVSVVHLNLQGRTTFLPAAREPGGSTAAGGPLAVVPAQVYAAPALLVEHDRPIGDLAVDKNRHVYLLEAGGQGRRILTSQPGPDQGAAGLRDLNADGALAPASLALPLDNRLHVLDRQTDGKLTLKRLGAGEAWDEVSLDLSGLAPDARLQQLRTSRTGQLEVLVASADAAQGVWHAVLPPMTVTDAHGAKQLAPARVAPLEVQQPHAEAGQNAGTNEIVNHRQPSRLPVGNGVASLRSTLLGNLSTDPLTATSVWQSWKETSVDHAKHIAASLGAVVLDSARAFANNLGFTAMPADQFERLKGHFHEAQLAHAALHAEFDGGAGALAAAFRQAYALPPADAEQSQGWPMGLLTPRRDLLASHGHAIAEARVQSLETLLFDLRKIGIKDRGLDPSLDPKPDRFSAANASYKAADLWRGATHLLGGQGDLLPGLRAAFEQLPDDATLAQTQGLGEHERGLLVQLRGLLRTLEAGGVRIPGAPGTAPDSQAGDARRDLRDAHAIRSANIARTLVQYKRLLALENVEQLHAVEAARQHSDTAGLGRLARLGISSWSGLEALDDIVAVFRAAMDDPGSARRRQLLKSLGLPADARRDEMAARMTDLLQDLYNRSTFFSVASDNKSVAVSISDTRMQVLGYSATPSAGGEHIHALGVERIGDSLEGDAGLVAFFVRHNKASLALSMAKDIDVNPSREGDKEERSVQPFKDELNKAAKEKASFSLSAAGRLSLGAAMQHGAGAAVILSPDTIPEFARLLFDAEHEDATELIAIGVNRGGIGLDLFETNLDAKGALAANTGFSAKPPHSFGAQKPLNPADAAAVEGPENRRGTWSAGAGAGLTADFGMHWNEMELHLDHAWKNILGLEYQGRFDFNTSFDAGLNIGSALSAAIGNMFARMDALTAPNQSNLRLAGVNLAMGNGNFFEMLNPALNGLKALGALAGGPDGKLGLAPATYKRTLDAEAAAPVGQEQWNAMGARLGKVFPQAAVPPFTDLAGERMASIDALLVHIQGQEALALEQGAAPDDQRWQEDARAATARAVDSGQAWRPKSEAARADVLNDLKLLRQQDSTALQQRAMLIPGARIELNLLGKGSLDSTVTQAVGHWHLGAKMGELDAVKQQIPGMADVLKRIKDNSENIDQVRFVFEMRPQALRALNDAMALQRLQQAAAEGGPALSAPQQERLALSWHEVMHMARSSPDLYRLAVIVPHNTDDNPSAVNTGFLGFNHGRAASKAHQLFQSEVQLRYDMYDRLVGAEVLEGAGRALAKDFDAMQRQGVTPVAVPRAPLDEGHFAPPSPRGEDLPR